MSFSSPTFLFFFFPIFFIIYFALSAVARNAMLLLASLAFYAIDGGSTTIILMASILINQIVGRSIHAAVDGPVRLALLWFGILLNLIPLIYYKYWRFLSGAGHDALMPLGLQIELSPGTIVLPAGISFFTFQGLSYLVDIYRREIQPARSVIDFGMYHTLFPQLIAGPIVRYVEVDNRIYRRPLVLADIEAGILRFCRGLGKKIIIADSMGTLADHMFALGPDRLSMTGAWIGALSYTLQIYFDFSGYSDMAIGLGQMLGFHFPENFDSNYPPLAFWRNVWISGGMDRNALQQLSKDQLIELVLQLQRPDKTSLTSSKPPSTDRKAKRVNARPGGAKPGHEPHNRLLATDPDEVRDHVPTVCDRCGGAFGAEAERELIGEYDEIEIPPVKPHVIRHRRFACRCGHCGIAAKAPAPAVATGTPFGPRIHALAIYYKGFQALSYERLSGMFRDAFGLSVSEGALMNMFIRSHAKFEVEAEKAKVVLRAARIVASDETGVRIEGTSAYHWVFHCKDAVVHQPDASRAARVVKDMMAGHVPDVWISDRYSAQQGHGTRHQTCLAHLARDTAFALEHGSDDLPLRFKLWLGKAFDLAKALTSFAASTLARKKRELEQQIVALLAARTGCDLAQQLQAKIGRAKDQLLTFCDYAGEVDVTNNTSERKLRPCVIQRKVTNGHRAMWAAEAEADVRTTIDTARLKGANPFDVIIATLA